MSHGREDVDVPIFAGRVLSALDKLRHDTKRVENIRARLQAVQDGHPWKYDPLHEMFMGTSNHIVMWDRNVDLGRKSDTWIQSTDPNIKGYVRSAESVRKNDMTHALGTFLERCREDMEYLLSVIGSDAQ